MKRLPAMVLAFLAVLCLLGGGAYGQSKNKKDDPDAIGDRDVGSGKRCGP